MRPFAPESLGVGTTKAEFTSKKKGIVETIPLKPDFHAKPFKLKEIGLDETVLAEPNLLYCSYERNRFLRFNKRDDKMNPPKPYCALHTSWNASIKAMVSPCCLKCEPKYLRYHFEVVRLWARQLADILDSGCEDYCTRIKGEVMFGNCRTCEVRKELSLVAGDGKT